MTYLAGGKHLNVAREGYSLRRWNTGFRETVLSIAADRR